MKGYFRTLTVGILIFIFTWTAFIFYFYSLTKDDSYGKASHSLDAIDSVEPPDKASEDTAMNQQLQSGEAGTIAQITPIKGWNLIWHDEFDYPSLSRSKWTAENWAAEKNNELQYYTPNNISIENNLLIIESRMENFNGRAYTSGAMHTKNKFSFLYGKVEMRARLPTGQGIFPAFWMMPNQDQKWLPEIDILEMLGHQSDEIWMVIHWLDDNQQLSSLSDSYRGPDYSADFHTFGIEWTPNQIIWLIDGIERFKVDTFIPKEEMYLYVNTAIGGDWPGSPNQTTRFPQYFEIDYIRVFQKAGD